MSSLIVEVVEIEEVEPHPNADRLDVAKVKGWYCIVQKDTYNTGDLVVFIPPDCILPDELIEKYDLSYLKNGKRTGTIKLRGFISQGLILPVPDGKWNIGDDVSGVLGITKWMPPERNISESKGTGTVSKRRINPFFTRYTEIENVKNFTGIFKEGEEVVITEKIHGSNWRMANLPIEISRDQPLAYRIVAWWKKAILHQTHELCLGSHNVQLLGSQKTYYDRNIYSDAARKNGMEFIIPEGWTVYGEVYGAGVQDLTYGLEGIDLVIFDVKAGDRYLDWDELLDFCVRNQLRPVPVLYIGRFSQEVLDFNTAGMSLLCPTQIREGCVVKPLHEQTHPRLGRKILKSINPDYLTRKNGTEYR